MFLVSTFRHQEDTRSPQPRSAHLHTAPWLPELTMRL
jgi:hypothetical protein